MFWLEILLTLMFMLIVAMLRALFKINKTLGRLESELMLTQQKQRVMEKKQKEYNKNKEDKNVKI